MERIYQLDGLRFIMICIIFMGHCFSEFLCNYSYGWVQNVFSSNFALDYFFILSGFGIYLNNYSKKVDYSYVDLVSSLKYAINKVRKIYPLYVFSMLLYIPLLSFWIGNIMGNIIVFFISLTLLQALAFSTKISHGINGVSWFLSALFISYIFCPFLYKLSNSKKISGLLIVDLLVIAMLVYISFTYADVGFPIYGNLVFSLGNMAPAIPSLFVFFFGMLIARIYITFKGTSFKNRYVYFMVLICIFFQLFRVMSVDIVGQIPLRLLCVILCGFFILSVSLNSENRISRFFKTVPMLTLGKYTMYIYLLHYPAIFMCHECFENYAIYYGDITGVIELLCVAVLTFLLILFYLKIEALVISIRNKLSVLKKGLVSK